MSLRIRINPSAGVPLYRQIAAEVKTAFLQSAIRPGEKLPSVRELAAELGMNPTTIVKAYDLLENQNLIVRRQGQGAFVANGDALVPQRTRLEIARKLSRELAIEGRRLGLAEREVLELVREELERLRPPRKEGR